MTTASAAPPRSRGHACLGLTLAAVAGIALLAWASFAAPRPLLVYNPTDSVAVGWYRIDAPARRVDALPVGSVVLARLPAAAAALAAQRDYLPAHVPLLKRVGAVAPQCVCIVGREVRIDGMPAAAVLRVDRMGRPLHAWPTCRRLQPGELFLLSVTNTSSYDSRYFGPIRTDAVLGVAHRLGPGMRP